MLLKLVDKLKSKGFKLSNKKLSSGGNGKVYINKALG
jgi:hypothetical protein